MNASVDFLALAEQVRQGDAAAAARLRRELEPRLVVIVGRALRTENRSLPLTEWIQAQTREARALLGQRGGDDSAGLVAVVARRVGEWLVNRLRSGTCSPQLLETVCA